MTSLSTAVWARILGGTTTFGDLKTGDRFFFPHRGTASAVTYEKLKGGWYQRVTFSDRGSPPKFRTGSGTTVIKVER